MRDEGAGGARISGRRQELEALDDFVTAAAASTALLLVGRPGTGKTTLWEAGIRVARDRGLHVLSARASDAEAQFSFAALVDLLDGIDIDGLGVPRPHRDAVEVALLRADPSSMQPDDRAISMGFVGALRGLAARRPVVVAVDDVQWLDKASEDVLTFAAPRLAESPIRFLFAGRRGDAGLARVLEQRLTRLQVRHLSLGAMRQMLSDRLGLTVPRRVLLTIFESTEGNPLFALEVGRMLAERGLPRIGEDMPLPDRVEDLLGTRVAALPEPFRRLLLAVALSRDLRSSQLARIADRAAIAESVDRGLVAVDSDRARPSHPLLGAAAIVHAGRAERRTLHLELAAVVADETLRAHHLAVATDSPDEVLAARVARAAAGAAARGARQDAVELAEHALRLTRSGTPERSERLLALAAHLETAGDLERVTDLLLPELESLPLGAMRARAWLILAEGTHVQTVDDYRRHLDQALAECEDEPALRARAVAKRSSAVIAVERIHEAEAEAAAVLPVARRAGPDEERLVLLALGWARALLGRSIDDVCERFRAASATTAHITESPERVAAQRHVWRGETHDARAFITRLLTTADERGEAVSYAVSRLHLCELELRTGNWDAAARLLDEWAESADRYVLVPPMYERCRSLLAVGRGFPEDAERWAAEAIDRAAAMGVQWDWLEAMRARGVAELLAHEPVRASESLGTVWEHTVREGVEEPGAFPVAPELVETLVEIGRPDHAATVAARLRDLAEQRQHPWGTVAANRCRATVALAAGYDQEAVELLEQAAGDYGRLGLRFDRARSLLALGRGQRRHRKWAAARQTLERAAAVCDEIGSPGWADEARSELTRVGARRPPRTGDLTAAELRAVELAADGLTNTQIAHALFVSVHTVEVHLSHAYAKLGIRSRAQLARALSARRPSPKV
jgi:DNA-binding CsgD family transcriptional regulator